MNATPREENRELVVELIERTAEILTMVHNALKPFAEISFVAKTSDPAYSRVAALFLKMCEDRFVSITDAFNTLTNHTKSDDFSVNYAVGKQKEIESDIMHMVNILTIHEKRSQGDILTDFAESFITFAEYGYLPIVDTIQDESPELAAFLLQESVLARLDHCYPRLAEVYPPQKMPFIAGNITQIKRALRGHSNSFDQADELASLITSNNIAMLQQITAKAA